MGIESVHLIKSFKHDGSLHRVWMKNWLVPEYKLYSEHAKASMLVLINNQTPIQESDGREWISRIPGVSFFIPGKWYNIVALIEEEGIRYYCNVASPFYRFQNVLTYIDYDLDVIVTQQGEIQVVDQDEYDRHRKLYHYSTEVERKVQAGFEELLNLAARRDMPFRDDWVKDYYEMWKKRGT